VSEKTELEVIREALVRVAKELHPYTPDVWEDQMENGGVELGFDFAIFAFDSDGNLTDFSA